MDRPRVIVTRPLAQALPEVQALRAAGVDAVALPLIAIEPVADPGPVREAWRTLPATALVVFVSANAVQAFFALRDGAPWPATTRAGSTGPGTTAALRAAGVPPDRIVEPAPGASLDSESLWRQLRSADWRARAVLVVRGEDGRDWLAEQMRAAGAAVRFVAAYRRAPPRPDAEAHALLAAAQAAPTLHLWMFTSSEALSNLRALAPAADWSRGRAWATHERIAQAARGAGFGEVQLVAPGAPALLERLARLQSAGS
jgi:uroporphyrinogen-III synthase